MLYIGEKVGMAHAKDIDGARRRASTQVDIAVDPLEGTNLCATGAPNAIAVLAASNQRRPAACARSVHGEAGRRPELEGRGQPRRAGAGEPRRDRQVSRPAASRIWWSIVLERERHEKLIGDIRATGARIRLIGDGDLSAGIAAARRRLRRARGDGHRRRAGRRADRGGDALPQRRDLRAPRRQQAGARGALPRDGDHRLQEDLSIEGSRARRATSSSRRPASPTATLMKRRPILRRRHPHQLGDHAERSAPDPVHRQHSRRAGRQRQNPLLKRCLVLSAGAGCSVLGAR